MPRAPVLPLNAFAASHRLCIAACYVEQLKVAPDLDVAFKDEADRDAVRTFMDLLDRVDK